MKILEICQFLHVFAFFVLILLIFSRNSEFVQENSTKLTEKRESLQVFREFSQLSHLSKEISQISHGNALIYEAFEEIPAESRENAEFLRKTQRFLLYLLLGMVFFTLGGAFRMGVLLKIQIF